MKKWVKILLIIVIVLVVATAIFLIIEGALPNSIIKKGSSNCGSDGCTIG